MKPKLLIAESDTDLRDVYQTFLGGRGYDVLTAADGLECLERLVRVKPRVLVLDQGIPWGGADGVLAWLREEKATAGVGVILTATVASPPGLEERLEPPIEKFLYKPFGLAALLESVRAILDKEQKEPLHLNRAEACSEFFIG